MKGKYGVKEIKIQVIAIPQKVRFETIFRIMVLAVTFQVFPSGAVTSTWNGGGGDDNWTTAANWGGTAPVAGNDLIFAGSTRLTPNNNFTSTSFNSITINSGSGAFTIGGNAFTLTGGATAITDNSTASISITPAITIATNAATITTITGGTLNIGTGTLNNGGLALTLASTGTTNISGIITGSGSITLNGNGTVTLSGANTYSGTTTISTGTLNLTGSLASGSAVTVASVATLTGNGTASGAVTVNGIVTPIYTSSTAYKLNAGATVMASTTILNMTLGHDNPQVNVSGNFTLDGTVNITAGTGFQPGSYPIVTYTGTLTNNTLNVGTLPTGYSGSITAASGVVTLNLADFSGWSYGTTINFNTTSTGANVTSNLTNFPMLIRLDSNNFVFEQAMPDGRDLRFSDADGSPLDYEIERYDATLKKAEIWVKVPIVDGNSDRDFINFYWGNASATAVTSGSAVFTSGNSWVGDWHLKQSGAQPSFVDASGANNTGAGQGVANGDTATANIGFGSKLDGSSKYISTTNSYVNPVTFTTGCWFKTSTTLGGYLIGFNNSTTGAGTNYDRHLWMDNTGKLNFGLYPSAYKIISSTLAYNDGAWHMAVARLGASGQFLYVDGAQVATDGTVTTAQNFTGFWRAGYSNLGIWTPTPTSSYFNGILDEVFVNHSQFSADWIKLSYATQRLNTTAVNFPNTALSTFSYSSKIYVNTTASGGYISTNQTNYPMLVRLTKANFDFSKAKTNGADLRFADSTGALLSYEIERYDATNRLAEIWVLLPTVNANNNSQWFKMVWGKPSATSLSSGAAVFNSTNNFGGVWHLKEVGNNTAGGYADATPNANNGQGTAFTNTSDVTGMIGKGLTFTGSTWINCGGGATGSSLQFPTALTLEAWVKPTTIGGNDKVMHMTVAASHQAPWTDYGMLLRTSQFGGEVVTGGSLTSANGNVPPVAGVWSHVVITYDGANQKVYQNGIFETSTAQTGTVNDYGRPLYLGVNINSTSEVFIGVMDEARVGNSARSADWIKLDYESQKTTSTVITVGARPSDFSASVRFNFNTAGVGVTTNVTNIPILVSLTSSNFDFTKTTNTGTDIQFIDKDGSYLYHEVVEWDKGNSTGKVWVKVPQVDGNVTTDFITLYYGCATCTASPYAVKDSVWAGFNGVWHLPGDGNTVSDGTKYNNTLISSSDQPSGPGVTVPLAKSFDGVGDYAAIADPAGGELDFGTGDFTCGIWAKTNNVGNAGVYPPMLSKEGVEASRTGYDLIFLNGGSVAGTVGFEAWSAGTNAYKGSTANSYNDGAWHYYVGKKTATAIELFIDGASQGTTAHSLGTTSNISDFGIGRDVISGAAYYFTGSLAEAQVAPSALTADFIKLSYQNQKANSTLFSTTTFMANTSFFQKSKIIKINTTSSGANVSGDVYNFPLLLRFNANNNPGIVALCVSTGADIRFLDGDGVTWLDYEIERFNSGIDSAEIWVKIPKVEGNSSKGFITMYYQKVSTVTVPDGQCGSCVFPANNGFVGVWHLNTSGTGARPNSVSGGNSLTPSGYTGAEYIIANIANGDQLDGTNDHLNMGSGYADFTTGFTFSVWAYPTASGSNARFCDIGSGQAIDNAVFSRASTGTNLQFENYNNTSSGGWVTATGAITNNVWQLFTATMDPQLNVKLYKNGTLVQSGVNTRSLRNISRTSAYIGRSNSGSDAYYTGRLDEPQLSKVARDANWINLAYQNQRTDSLKLFNSSPSDFVSTKKYTFNTTKTGANVKGDVTNFPMLVRITPSGLTGTLQGSDPNAPNDIRFLDGDGKTWLNYQVERWSRSLDSAEVWVMVPKVDGNSDHDFITLYYNDVTNGAVPNGECASCVFGTSASYAGTWHLATNVTDAGGTYNGTDFSTTDVGGLIGRGRGFSGSSQYITATLPVTNDFTIAFWMKTSTAGASSSPDSWSSSGIVDGGVGGVNNDWSVGINGKVVDFGTGNPDNTILTVSPDTVQSGTWKYVVATRNKTAGTKYIYVDGSLKASGTSNTNSLNAATSLYIGRIQENGNYYTGNLDEIQISSVVRDTNWIKLSYETQRYTNNQFWNTRVSPNNLVSLTATASSSNIALSWNTPVSDSTNADSVGIWVKYTTFPDSVPTTPGTSAPATRVVILPKTDTTYTYPATYPGTYYFALAVRNTNGKWSPFTATSSDTANLSGTAFKTDTIYVDSAIGNDANTCAQAQNPATPRLTISGSDGECDSYASDTLVIRVMSGTYSGASNTVLNPIVKPITLVSFDNKSRAIISTNTNSVSWNSVTYWPALSLYGSARVSNMDFMSSKASVTTSVGVMTIANAPNIVIEGCRFYNGATTNFDNGIILTTNANSFQVSNNLIYQPTTNGIWCEKDDNVNVVNNTLIGTGAANTKGINFITAAYANNMTISNNILYNWDYGIYTVSTTAATGVISNNLFFKVTTNRDLTVATDANKINKDPMFANMIMGNSNAFKLLPGSPAIDAGTTTYASGGTPTAFRSSYDFFNNARTQGTAPDIGMYEGTGYTPNPTGDFDTLITLTTSSTVTVKNSKWKLIFDAARGSGINFFSDMNNPTPADSATNLLAASSLLFDAKIGSYTASAGANAIMPWLMERTKTRAVVRQLCPVSANLNLYIYYSIYASGHIYINAEIQNLTTNSQALTSVDYTLKLGTTTSSYSSTGTTKGFGYLTTGTRDALLSVVKDLDGGAATAETWTSTATSGSPGTVVFSTANPSDCAKYMQRRYGFLLYIGDLALDYQKSATLNADAYNPSVISPSAGSLLLERSWQQALNGHWTLDDGAGTVARDKAVYFTNNATISSTANPVNYKWVSGKVNGGLYLTQTDVAVVTSATALDATTGGTYMFWVKPDFAGMTSASTAFIISKGLTTGSGWYFRKVANQNQIQFNMGAASVISPTLTDGVWTHIVAVVKAYPDQHIDLYVNGLLSAVSTASATATANATDLRFGENAGSGTVDRFIGTLDDIRIFKSEVAYGDIQAIAAIGFSAKYGCYKLRADNNNRMVALINGNAAQTRLQPSFGITNWSASTAPKYVYLNGVRLKPNVDFVADTITSGSELVLQLNKALTTADQTLFVDDDDSTGYMGTAAKMMSLTMQGYSNDKITIKNFSNTVFSGASSGQWYTELDLNGWPDLTSYGTTRVIDSGFGGFNVWKAAAVSPNVAITGATNLTGQDDNQGKILCDLHYDNLNAALNASGAGYVGPVNIGYTLVDSSSTRLSLTLASMSLQSGAGTATLVKRWTIYPTGRIFGSETVSSPSFSFNQPSIEILSRYNTNVSTVWSTTTAVSKGGWGIFGGDLSMHSILGGLLSVKNATSNYTAISSASSSSGNTSGQDNFHLSLISATSQFTSANAPVTTNFFVDISRDFTDSATADSLLTDLRTPAVITNITGTQVRGSAANPLNPAADDFSEGDGAYTYAAHTSGVAHFKFVNTVTCFNPAFRISSWTFGTLPEYVIVDNQSLTLGYHYNAYLNAASGEIILQINRTLAPGTHVFFISHKTGLAIKLNRFEAISGNGVDTLQWTTESEFENLGFHVYRRLASTMVNPDSVLAKGQKVVVEGNLPDDTLPSMSLTPEKLAALGYERITLKMIPGAQGGSSASTKEYQYIDRSAAFGVAYEYLLEAVDFNGTHEQYGPRFARPYNPLTTELYPNYPNPFNPITTLHFSLKEKAKVSLIIYDGKGRIVRTLLRPDKPMQPGKYRLIWDAKNEGGLEVPSGQYFYRFTAPHYYKTRKMILVK